MLNFKIILRAKIDYQIGTVKNLKDMYVYYRQESYKSHENQEQSVQK